MLSNYFHIGESAELRNVIAPLGLADVREFGLTLEDCNALLQQFGFGARIEIVSA